MSGYEGGGGDYGGRGNESVNKCFVGNLSWNTDDYSLGEYFKQFGEVVDAHVMTERDTGRSRGFGYVTFSDAAGMDEANNRANETELDGRIIRVNSAQPKSAGGGGGGWQSNRNGNGGGGGGGGYGGGGGGYGGGGGDYGGGSRGNDSGNKCFVGNLSWDTDDYSLREYFKQFGEVVDAHVMTERDTGRSRGFGFVTFADAAGMDEANNRANESELDGRTIRVNSAQPKSAGGGGGGGYRGGGGYGGGYGGDRGGGW